LFRLNRLMGIAIVPNKPFQPCLIFESKQVVAYLRICNKHLNGIRKLMAVAFVPGMLFQASLIFECKPVDYLIIGTNI
jgi:hypothetical protein